MQAPGIRAEGRPLLFDGRRTNPLGATRRDVLGLAALGVLSSVASPVHAAASDGQLIIGVHISLAPTWFDPAETAGIITPFLVMYALHDAMLKALPGQNPAPCLPESWTAKSDG